MDAKIAIFQKKNIRREVYKAEDGAELSTFCRQLKLKAADGKKYLTDCAIQNHSSAFT